MFFDDSTVEHDFFKTSPALDVLATQALQTCQQYFDEIDRISEVNTKKVLSAYMNHRVSDSHLIGSSGYGYGDRGRDTLDAVFAEIMGAQDALVRHHFVSGTAAIAHGLFGVLRPGDTMVSLSGLPYDTLHAVIGIREGGHGSLKEFGIQYKQVDLLEDGSVDLQAIPAAVKNVKVAYLQRSRGYSLRPSITIAQMKEIFAIVRKANPEVLIVVDNCYGELVEEQEPTQVGADLMMGSLIKNPGGGIARTGGYIAGRADLVELCAHRITAPGVGRDVGASLHETKNMFMGLFYSPAVVASAVKTAVYAAALFQQMGFAVTPLSHEVRTDIIQAVVLNTPAYLTAFCEGVQKGAPIDSFVTPIPSDMPGYDDPVIMAAGAFNNGASIELSADGPMREPFAVWLQGGLTWPSGKLGVTMAAQTVLDKGYKLPE